MSIAPFAIWRPLPPGVNHSAGGMVAYNSVVLHIMQGILDGTDSWFRNPQAQASAHFGVGKDGRVYQWVDTADMAWAQAAGNPRNISIENEGNAGDSLTAAQVEQVAEILAWAHTTHGVPLRINDFPVGQGLGWHGMGGAAWGGHTGCPGDPIKAQRLGIITRAQAILDSQPVPQPSTEEDDMLTFTDGNGHFRCGPDGAVYAFDLHGHPGGKRSTGIDLYLGGLNVHPAWQAGAGTPNGAPFIFGPTPEGGYVITTKDGGGNFHPYVFPPDGSLAH
jgi:N-acetylmuramoyl-L-alanine amidase-like protein